MAQISKTAKIVLIVVGALLAIAVVAALVINARYSSVIKTKLKEEVAKASDSLYHISVKKARINLFTLAVTLKEVELWPDSAKMKALEKDSVAPANYFHIKVPKLHVSGIMWDELTGGEGFSSDRFEIRNAQVTIYKNDSALQKNDTVAKKRDKQQEFTIGTLACSNAYIQYITNRSSKDSNTFHFRKTNITLDNWEYSPGSKDTTRFLMAESGKISIGKFEYDKKGFNYHFTAKNINFNSESRKFTAGNVALKLKMSNKEFFSKQRMQKEIYDLHLPTLEVTDIAWEKLLQNGALHAGTVYLNNTSVKVYFSRLLPENTKSKLGKFPNQMLYKLRMPVYVEDMRFNNGSIMYSEISEKTGKEGSIHFTAVNGKAENITNIQEKVDSDNNCVVKLAGKFNKYTDISATFRFRLNDATGHFSVDANLGQLQARQINEQMKTFTLIEVKSLQMKSLTARIAGDEMAAGGDFKMLYNNLGIKVLKKDTDEKREKRKKGFITFLANNLVLYSANPMPGDEVRTAETQVDRNIYKSFFNLIWRNIHQGVQETTIRDLDVIKWFRDNENKHQDGRLRRMFSQEGKKKERKRED